MLFMCHWAGSDAKAESGCRYRVVRVDFGDSADGRRGMACEAEHVDLYRGSNVARVGVAPRPARNVILPPVPAAELFNRPAAGRNHQMVASGGWLAGTAGDRARG